MRTDTDLMTMELQRKQKKCEFRIHRKIEVAPFWKGALSFRTHSGDRLAPLANNQSGDYNLKCRAPALSVYAPF